MAQKVLERPPPGLEKAMERISPTEELCVEHGMLDRVMLAMDNTLKAASKSKKSDLKPIKSACAFINDVVDAHHMKIEEREIYPKFKNDRLLAPLASELKVQHDNARKMVARIDKLAGSANPDIDEMTRVFADLKDMLTAHAAREQSVLFPAMLGTWSEKELKHLKEAQEEDEKKLLGEDADEKAYQMLGDIESASGIDSLKDFTRSL